MIMRKLVYYGVPTVIYGSMIWFLFYIGYIGLLYARDSLLNSTNNIADALIVMLVGIVCLFIINIVVVMVQGYIVVIRKYKELLGLIKEREDVE